MKGTPSIPRGTLCVGYVGSSSRDNAMYPYGIALFEGAYKGGLPLSFEWIVERKTGKEDLPPSVVVQKAWTKGPLAMFQIWKAVRKGGFGIAHIQYEQFLYAEGIAALTIPISLALLRLVGGFRSIKIVMTLHEVPPLSSIGPALSRQYFIPRVPFIFLRASLLLMMRLLSFSADSLVVHLKSFASVLSQSYKVSKNKIAVIPIGVARRHIGSSDGRDVLFFGFVTPNKGIEALVGSYDSLPLPGVRLAIVGGRHRRDNGYFEKVKTLISQSQKADLISLTGYVGEDELQNYFQSAGVVVLPYKNAFSASFALSYALSYERPVIVPPLQAFRESLGDAGIYAETEPGQLATAIFRVLTDRDYASVCQQKVRERAKMLSWENCARMTMAVYLKLLGMENN